MRLKVLTRRNRDAPRRPFQYKIHHFEYKVHHFQHKIHCLKPKKHYFKSKPAPRARPVATRREESVRGLPGIQVVVEGACVATAVPAEPVKPEI